jgi:hypothetical protein
MLPTYYAAIVILGGLFGANHRVLYWQMALCVFGGGAAFLLVGGSNVTPAVAYLPYLMYRALKERERTPFGQNTRLAKGSFWVLALAAWGVLSALLLPRLFAGVVQVMTIERDSGKAMTVLAPLRPLSGNVTQTGYLIGGALAFLSMRVLLSREGRMEHFKRAVLVLGSLDAFFGLLNLGEFWAGLPPMLALLRNARYAQFENDVSNGLVRIQGTFPETSMFSAFTMPLFAFCFSLWFHDRKARYPGLLALVLLTLLLLSTSTTAYAAIGVYLAGFAAQMLAIAYSKGKLPRLEWFVMIVGTVLLLIGSAFVFELEVTHKVVDFFNHTVFDKLDSHSGEVRSSWNAQAWANFLDTYGVGVGMGSARASSFALVLLSNLGAIGLLLFAAFMRQVWVGARLESAWDASIPSAARHAAFAAVISSCMSATVFDLGVAFYAYAAAATVDPQRALRRQQIHESEAMPLSRAA